MIDFFNTSDNYLNYNMQQEGLFSPENENSQNQEFERQNLSLNSENIVHVQNSLNNERTDDKTKNLFVTHKKLGRKRKLSLGDDNNHSHNKYSDDNIRRKIKHLVIKSFQEFLNNLINKMDINCPKLLILNQSQKFNATIQYNQDFLSKRLKDIFSENISQRYRKFSQDHNSKVIYKLLNCIDEEKKNYFIKLLNLTFLETLKHFRGEEEIEELNGMALFEDIKNNSNWEKDYKKVLSDYIDNYETFINNKKARKRRRIN